MVNLLTDGDTRTHTDKSPDCGDGPGTVDTTTQMGPDGHSGPVGVGTIKVTEVIDR
jgi:hypothetical protein